MEINIQLKVFFFLAPLAIVHRIVTGPSVTQAVCRGRQIEFQTAPILCVSEKGSEMCVCCLVSRHREEKKMEKECLQETQPSSQCPRSSQAHSEEMCEQNSSLIKN